MKKPFSLFLIFFILFNYVNDFNSALAVGNAASSETTVIGKVAPTIIKVSAPAIIAFSIDPNLEEEESRFTSSDINIVNNSNAPVKVKIKVGSENFTLLSNSKWKPENVMPENFIWDKLGTKKSESYIALGIKPENGAWRRIDRSDPLYVVEQNISDQDIVFGEIEGKSNADMSLVCSHGLSFGTRKECAYRIILTFSIGD